MPRASTTTPVVEPAPPPAAIAPAQSQAIAAPVRDTRGKETLDDTDIYPARLSLAQDTTPQAKKREDAYIDGLEPGMYFNAITGEIFGENVTVAIVGVSKRAMIFGEDGKILERGLRWDDERCLSPGEDEKGQWIKPEATRIYDYLVVRVDDGQPTNVMMLSCKKTAFKAGKRLNSLLQQTPGAAWETLYSLSTAVESGGGNTYFVPKFAYLSPKKDARKTPDVVNAFCAGLYDLLKKGRVQEVEEDVADGPDRSDSDVPY